MDKLGIRVVVRDAQTYDDLGTCTAPPPVVPGDVISFEHGTPLRVLSVLPTSTSSRVVPVVARPAALAIIAR